MPVETSQNVTPKRLRTNLMSHDFAHAYMTLLLEPEPETNVYVSHLGGDKWALTLAADACDVSFHTRDRVRLVALLRQMADELEGAPYAR